MNSEATGLPWVRLDGSLGQVSIFFTPPRAERYECDLHIKLAPQNRISVQGSQTFLQI